MVFTFLDDFIIIIIFLLQNKKDHSEEIERLQQELSEVHAHVGEAEKEHESELESQRKHAHKLDKKLSKAQKSLEEAEGQRRELESQLKVAKEAAEEESKAKQEVSLYGLPIFYPSLPILRCNFCIFRVQSFSLHQELALSDCFSLNRSIQAYCIKLRARRRFLAKF